VYKKKGQIREKKKGRTCVRRKGFVGCQSRTKPIDPHRKERRKASLKEPAKGGGKKKKSQRRRNTPFLGIWGITHLSEVQDKGYCNGNAKHRGVDGKVLYSPTRKGRKKKILEISFHDVLVKTPQKPGGKGKGNIGGGGGRGSKHQRPFSSRT